VPVRGLATVLPSLEDLFVGLTGEGSMSTADTSTRRMTGTVPAPAVAWLRLLRSPIDTTTLLHGLVTWPSSAPSPGLAEEVPLEKPVWGVHNDASRGLEAGARFSGRVESAWSNGKPAYRCRHGYTSAVRPSPTRPKNLYVHEELILPRLAALAILHTEADRARRGHKQNNAHVTGPGQAADLIDRLRSAGTTLIYDPATRALRTGTNHTVAITIS
jgi:hypothetical protein